MWLPTFTYFTYEQVYAEDGSPIEGEYVDQNGDGVINPDDLIRFDGNPAPDMFLGFFANYTHNKWTAGMSVRGEFGGYVYNNVNSSLGNYFNVGSTKGYLANMTTDYLNTVFQTPQYLSDYYVEKASYIRLDNIYVGYNFGRVIADKVGLALTAIVQNALVVSSYSGLDPEVAGGIDNNFYPASTHLRSEPQSSILKSRYDEKSTIWGFTILASVSLFFSSCFKDLDLSPKYGLNTESVYEDPANYIHVLAKLYAGLSITGNQGLRAAQISVVLMKDSPHMYGYYGTCRNCPQMKPSVAGTTRVFPNSTPVPGTPPAPLYRPCTTGYSTRYHCVMNSSASVQMTG